MKTLTSTRRPLADNVPFAVLPLLAVALPLHADQFGDFTYTDRGPTIEITDYPTSATGPVAIPATIVGKPVTSIGNDAFRSCSSLTSVTIPSSVTSIRDGAFFGCDDLTSVTIPSAVTSIGNDAFHACLDLASVTIPSSVTSIGNKAFERCVSLTSVTIPSSVTRIGYGPFADCNRLSSITVDASNLYYSSLDGVLFDKLQRLLIQSTQAAQIGSYAIPSSVTSIEDYAFFGCWSLTSVTMPSSVTSIGSNAFRGCSSLNSATIPSSVTSIGQVAFQGSGLTSLTFESPSSVTSIGEFTFAGCSSLTSVTFGSPSSMTSIGAFAFDRCKNLTSVTIPSSVTRVNYRAFFGCSALMSVTIPSSVTSIDNEAFRRCSSLTSVTIPSSVTSIGDGAFTNCSSLVLAWFEGDTPAVGNGVFDSAAPGFTTYYLTGSTGFTSPTWEGYPTVEIDQSVYPAAAWLLTHNLSSETDLQQDLNGDGVTLLAAYALNLDPNNPVAGMPVPVLDPATMSMTFYGAAQRVAYGAETSTDLRTWVTAGVTISELDPASMRTVTVNRGSTRRFLRLTFSHNP